MEPGIYDGISHDEYLRIDAASASTLKQMIKSPAHCLEYKKNPPQPTAAMNFGTAVHITLLEHDSESDRIAVEPVVNKRAKVGKEIYEQFLEHAAGKAIITGEQSIALERIKFNVENHSAASKCLKGGQSELSVFWNDEETDYPCKARADLIHENGLVIDIKTTRDASEEEFKRQSFNLRYHMQAAWYIDGISRFKEVSSFVFVCVETSPPYGVAVYALDGDAIQYGRDQYREYLNQYVECKKTDTWPCYPDFVQGLSLPHWVQ